MNTNTSIEFYLQLTFIELSEYIEDYNELVDEYNKAVRNGK